jgi:hypothetical protein
MKNGFSKPVGFGILSTNLSIVVALFVSKSKHVRLCIKIVTIVEMRCFDGNKIDQLIFSIS